MSNLFPARNWREKPSGLVVPYSGNPHSAGLIAAWNMFEGAGARLHDLVGQNHGNITGNTVNWGQGGPQERSVLTFTGDANNHRVDLGSIATGNPLMLTATNFTIMAKVRPRTPYGSTFPRIIDKSNSGSGANGWALYHRTDRLTLAATGAESSSPVNSLLIADLENQWSVSCVSFRNSDDIVSLYSNHFDSPISRGGPMRLLGTAAGSNIATTTANAAIGNWNHTTDRNWAGDISWIYMWDRLLGLDEVNEVALAPHAMFQPVVSRTYFAMQTHSDLGTLGNNQITVISG